MYYVFMCIPWVWDIGIDDEEDSLLGSEMEPLVRILSVPGGWVTVPDGSTKSMYFVCVCVWEREEGKDEEGLMEHLMYTEDFAWTITYIIIIDIV